MRTRIRRSLILALVLVATTALIPAAPAQATPNCAGPVDSLYNWTQDSCLILNQRGNLYGLSLVRLRPDFNVSRAKTCLAVLELRDQYNEPAYHYYNCIHDLRTQPTRTFFFEREWSYPRPGRVYRQYAYMIVETYSRKYDSRETRCPLIYWPSALETTACGG